MESCDPLTPWLLLVSRGSSYQDMSMTRNGEIELFWKYSPQMHKKWWDVSVGNRRSEYQHKPPVEGLVFASMISFEVQPVIYDRHSRPWPVSFKSSNAEILSNITVSRRVSAPRNNSRRSNQNPYQRRISITYLVYFGLAQVMHSDENGPGNTCKESALFQHSQRRIDKAGTKANKEMLFFFLQL